MVDIQHLTPANVSAIAPYPPGKPISELAREMGLNERDIVKLASNENPLGMSPKAREAMQRELADLGRYPDGNAFALKDAICGRYGVTHAQIVPGNGSNDVLELAARAFLAPGLEAVYSQHAFAVYPLVTQAIGAVGVTASAKNFGHDLDAMAAAITSNTRLVFIANPNNPTGTLLEKGALYAFLKGMPEHVIVVLDEAYDEYLPDSLKSESIAWLNEFDRLIVTRTLSKAYGLAGLRVGFALAQPELADMMNRVRQPFNVNSVAQAAAAAALHDVTFVEQSRALNDAGMAQITDGLKEMGLTYIPSFGNFVSFSVQQAQQVYQKLLRQGVIVRPVGNYQMPDYLRVSIGLPEENARFLQALTAALND